MSSTWPASAVEVELRRHDLVRPRPAAWAEHWASHAAPADPPWLADWAKQDWPLVARRACPDDPVGRIPLGLPLPPSAGKRRLELHLPPDALGPPEPPPRLSVVAASAPAAWRPTLGRLLALDSGVQVFGGLAWQALTGLDYLGSGSDLDLLWPLPPPGEARALLAAIAVVQVDAPMRLDGELVRVDGAAVNWRELAAGAEEVLVKRLHGVRLEPRAAFLEAAA